MYIEDLINELERMPSLMTNYELGIISSFGDQIDNGLGFTEKQSNLACKLINKYSFQLGCYLGKDISKYIENPLYKLTKRVISNTKSISIIKNSNNIKKIKVEFSYNESLIKSIRDFNRLNTIAAWDPEEHAWIFQLNEKSILFLSSFANANNFNTDAEFTDYLSQIENVTENLDKYIPIVRLRDNKIVFENVASTVPNCTSTDILESLFLARRSGIYTWDDNIEQWLSNNLSNSLVRRFLNHSSSTHFALNRTDNLSNDLSSIIKYSGTCLIVIPGGSELKLLKENLEILKLTNIDNSEISVLFRLPAPTEFNGFVRDNSLNNPLSKNIKVAFISSKFPKSIVESELAFDLIINYNFCNVHYTIKELLHYHHNVINVIT